MESVEGAIKVLLAEDLDKNNDIRSIRIKTFEETGFDVQIKPSSVSVGIKKSVSQMKALQRVPINNYSLVYSGAHDIQMI